MKRWIAPTALWLLASGFLWWAFPRLHAAARMKLAFDRDGYIENARRIAAMEGKDLAGWRSYARVEEQTKNEVLHDRMPDDAAARAFPEAEVFTKFVPPASGADATVDMRTDGRPLGWKLPAPHRKTTVPKALAKQKTDEAGHGAMVLMTNAEAPRYSLMADGMSSQDGMDYKWQEMGSGSDAPRIGIETVVQDGAAWQAKTEFKIPAHLDREAENVPNTRVAASIAWFVILIAALVFSVLHGGSAAVGQALKDGAAIGLGLAAATSVALVIFLQQDEVVTIPQAVISLGIATVFQGLVFYATVAATVLSAHWHPARVRGFRLLATSAFFSRTTGTEILGGWLVAPAFVAIPLAVSAIFRMPAYNGFGEGVLLSRLPALDAIFRVLTEQQLALVAYAGVLIPLALRFARGKLQWALILLQGTITWFMLLGPFRGGPIPNLVCAALSAAVTVWLYSRFGLLGTLAGSSLAGILASAGALLVQPAAGLVTSGWSVMAVFGCFGMVALAAAAKGPNTSLQLYGETAVAASRSRREQLLEEFQVARTVQQRMLPSHPPNLAGYSISACCEPAREVGGDLYDFPRLSDGRYGIGVADVSGKGVPAALYMTLTKGLLCAAAQESSDPRAILAAVNKHLRSVTKKKVFVTMALGVLDPAVRRFEYARAGHNPAVWRRSGAGETRLLAGGGIGLGIASPALFEKTLALESLVLEPGDALVFYSDGLTEAMDAQLEQFGEERLIAAVERTDGMQAVETRDTILRAVREFLKGGHSQDDLTIAVLRVDDEANGWSRS